MVAMRQTSDGTVVVDAMAGKGGARVVVGTVKKPLRQLKWVTSAMATLARRDEDVDVGTNDRAL